MAPQIVYPDMHQKHLIYVHGICRHDPGYSDAWFEAMRAYTPSLAPGERSNAPGDFAANRHEVIWSDLVNSHEEFATPMSAASENLGDRNADFTTCLRDLLADLELRKAAVESELAATASAEELLTLEHDLEGMSIPGQDCIDDFVVYLVDEEIRNLVISRFLSILLPLMEAGKEIEIIAHSWGTVVAYESMCRLAASSYPEQGQVNTFFTVGSALAINFVNNRLITEAENRRRPRICQTLE